MLIAFIIFMVLLFLGMPVAFSIALAGLSFFLITPELPLTIVVQRTIATSQSFTMLAVPLFIFAGHLMNHTGITTRLIKLSNVLVGHMWGHVAQVSIVLSALLSGVTGSATADAAMSARVLGPEMVKKGYKRSWGASINGVSAMITATLPPSMGLIIYGTVGEVSIGRLFMGGIIPGFMMMVFLMLAVRISAKKFGYKPERKISSFSEMLKALVDGIWALLFPIILIVFIRFGIFTPSESGAFAAIYAILVGVFVYKELTFAKFRTALINAVRDIGAIMLIISVSGVFGFGIVFERLGPLMASFITGVTENPILLMFVLVAVLLIIGSVLESTVVVLILTPILMPIITSVGIDPVQFGLVMMTIVTGGIMTPPMGIALFAVSDIMECKPEAVVKDAVPFYLAILAAVVLMILFPPLTLFLPNLLF